VCAPMLVNRPQRMSLSSRGTAILSQRAGLARDFGVPCLGGRREQQHEATERRRAMPKIKHIAISTQDVDTTAKFYIDVFGMKEIARVNSPGASGYYLSDGDLNLAILHFKNDAVAGVERGAGWSGIHHIGFAVESLEEIADKLA